MPVKAELDSFECRHGLGYTKITGERNGIRAEVLFFVPLGHTAEVHQVTLKNTGTTPRTLKLFSFVEFCLWNALRRHDQLPAQFQHPVRSRSKAARSITRPSTASAAITSRFIT